MSRSGSVVLNFHGLMGSAVHGLHWLSVNSSVLSQQNPAWGVCLLFPEPLFECQSGSTLIPQCTATAGLLWRYCVPDVHSPGPAPKSIWRNMGTHARGTSCCRHGVLRVLSGLENCKKGKSKIAWTWLVLQELHIALSQKKHLESA